MTTEVKCSICGLLIDSTTVTKKSYNRGEVIDHGCPYCGHGVPLRATRTVKTKTSAKKTPLPEEPEMLYLSGEMDGKQKPEKEENEEEK